MRCLSALEEDDRTLKTGSFGHMPRKRLVIWVGASVSRSAESRYAYGYGISGRLIAALHYNRRSVRGGCGGHKADEMK